MGFHSTPVHDMQCIIKRKRMERQKSGGRTTKVAPIFSPPGFSPMHLATGMGGGPASSISIYARAWMGSTCTVRQHHTLLSTITPVRPSAGWAFPLRMPLVYLQGTWRKAYLLHHYYCSVIYTYMPSITSYIHIMGIGYLSMYIASVMVQKNGNRNSQF